MDETKVNTLSVKVTFEVELGDIEISNEVLEEFKSAQKKGDKIFAGNYNNAFYWLITNISQLDSFDDEYEIENLIEYEKN